MIVLKQKYERKDTAGRFRYQKDAGGAARKENE